MQNSKGLGFQPAQGTIEIEKDGENENEDINLEYFVGGQKKYFLPSQNYQNLSERFSKDILMSENMLLRYKLKTEMGKRIDELELNEMILKAENERLNKRIKKLEEENRKLHEAEKK